MSEEVRRAISDMEFEFSNSRVRVEAECDFEALELPGLKIGPFSRGERYTIHLWVAEELEKKGVVKMVERPELSDEEFMRYHKRETGLSGGLFELPADFYPRLRRKLARLEEEAGRNPSSLQELERLRARAQDVVNARLKKIVSLASSVAKSPMTRRYLTPEEEVIFDLVGDLADAWRGEVIKVGR
ncbi:hypothetical protein DRO32_00440 [Candidatus Bathyarchaeota archaeon]|nr:MAG: hypothetical protein DRO32_00440 [Candidatus Bathyarchaeota archaeon]